jgi:hypothetical protein
MKAKVFSAIALYLILLPAFVFAQGRSTNKVGLQPSHAHYDRARQVHDASLKPDQKNPTTKIVDNLNNPEGTLVLNGSVKADRVRQGLEDFENIRFAESYVELPFQKGSATYRVPASNSSRHNPFTNDEVVSELRLYIKKCVDQTGEVPASVLLQHDYRIKSCQFLSFTSVSHLYAAPYHQARLNLACVRMPLHKETNWIAYGH